MGEFLAHLETLVGRIEAVFGYAPCARCGATKDEHTWPLGNRERREILGPIHDYRLPGSLLDRLNQNCASENWSY